MTTETMTPETTTTTTKPRELPLPAEAVIHFVGPNTKRPGTKAHAAFSLYAECKTVGDYLKAGGRRVELRWDLARDLIGVSVPMPGGLSFHLGGSHPEPDEETQD